MDGAGSHNPNFPSSIRADQYIPRMNNNLELSTHAFLMGTQKSNILKYSFNLATSSHSRGRVVA
jgi:hypothetical protein